MGHDQGRVCHPLTTGSESRACKSTPPFAHRPRPTGVPRMRATRRPVRPRLTLTPASPSAAEPTSRHPHRSPRPYLVALIGHTRPSSPPLSTKLPPSTLTVCPHPEPVEWCRSPRGGGVPRPPIRGRGPIECRSRCVEAGNQQRPRAQSAREYPPQPPTGGRGSPAPRKGSGTHRPKQSTQPAPHILLARRGSKGCWWAGMWPGVVWLVSECQ